MPNPGKKNSGVRGLKTPLCYGCPLWRGDAVCSECARNSRDDVIYAIQRKSKRQRRIEMREKHKRNGHSG